MEIKIDEIIKNANENYANFELNQLVVNMGVGETLTIMIDDATIKEYVAKYSDCHFNMTIQDKGIKRNPTEIEKIDAEIALLQLKKAEEEAKEVIP